MDIVQPHKRWFARGTSGMAPDTVVNTPKAPCSTNNGSIIRSALASTCKRLPLKPSIPSKTPAITPDHDSDFTKGSSQAPTLVQRDDQSPSSCPRHTPTTQSPRKLTKRSLPVTSQAIESAITSRSLPQKPSSFRLRLQQWTRRPDLLKSLKQDIQTTAQKIRSDTWCPTFSQETTSLDLTDMISADTLSPETKELLMTGLDEFQTYKTFEEEKQRMSAEEKQERMEIEKTLAVVDTMIVRKGPVYHRLQCLVPARSATSLRTLDPRAQFEMSVTPPSAGTSISGHDSASPDSEATGSMMDRSRGVARGGAPARYRKRQDSAQVC